MSVRSTLSNCKANAKDPILQFMEEVSIRIAIDLDLFNILIKRGTQQTLEGLAKVTGAEEVLLGMASADSTN